MIATPTDSHQNNQLTAALPSHPIYGYQTKMASQALVEAVNELSKRGFQGADLTNNSIEIATALHKGLSQINQLSQESCSKPSELCEPQ